ncbi:hypothetical protein AVEN_89284-1 [Araneus ventricosus]|uniref:Uncharacterized protein n=1 Tax=Araneus ventricosus TaxID=182803 RepID=A0A4Y2TVH2_ARAVE|nr:hypothetical protein AVEN_196175-1 [Araneus ventricosus]GBO04599.1 hypothetical protein AVEN_89284-1 [Araneus ventricosus]
MDGATSSLQHSLPSRASCYTGGLSLSKPHVRYSGNGATDVLAKKATQEGIPTYIPAPRNHIKSLLQKEFIIRWQKEWAMEKQTGVFTTFCLKSRQLLLHGKDPGHGVIITGQCPFPTYFKLFKIKNSDSYGCGKLGNSLHYATRCLFTTSYHLTKRSAELESLWWKRVMSNNNSSTSSRETKRPFFQMMVTLTRHRLN